MRSVDAPPFPVTAGLSVEDLAYADDIALLAETEAEAQFAIDQVCTAASKLGLKISAPKTKVLAYGMTDDPIIRLQGEVLECVDAFVYLGSKISGNVIAASEDVTSRIGKALGAFARLNRCLWSRHQLSIKTKMRVFNAIVKPTLLYGAECWTLLASYLQTKCLSNAMPSSDSERLNAPTTDERRDPPKML